MTTDSLAPAPIWAVLKAGGGKRAGVTKLAAGHTADESLRIAAGAAKFSQMTVRPSGQLHNSYRKGCSLPLPLEPLTATGAAQGDAGFDAWLYIAGQHIIWASIVAQHAVQQRASRSMRLVAGPTLLELANPSECGAAGHAAGLRIQLTAVISWPPVETSARVSAWSQHCFGISTDVWFPASKAEHVPDGNWCPCSRTDLSLQRMPQVVPIRGRLSKGWEQLAHQRAADAEIGYPRGQDPPIGLDLLRDVTCVGGATGRLLNNMPAVSVTNFPASCLSQAETAGSADGHDARTQHA